MPCFHGENTVFYFDVTGNVVDKRPKLAIMTLAVDSLETTARA
jgi:hypothetical protein